MHWWYKWALIPPIHLHLTRTSCVRRQSRITFAHTDTAIYCNRYLYRFCDSSVLSRSTSQSNAFAIASIYAQKHRCVARSCMQLCVKFCVNDQCRKSFVSLFFIFISIGRHLTRLEWLWLLFSLISFVLNFLTVSHLQKFSLEFYFIRLMRTKFSEFDSEFF